MLKRLLVPLDGSTLAENALPYAEEIARHFGSEIILVNVRTPTENLDNPEQRTYLTRMVATLEQDIKKSKDMPAGEKVKVTSAIIGSPGLTHPAEHILDYAAQENVSLIVMATHGRTGISRWTLGDTANKVARAFQCPLLLVRASAKPLKSVHFSNILVPLDGSLPSEAVLPYSELFASKLKAKITLLHVVETQYHLYPYGASMVYYYAAAGVIKVPYTEQEMKPMKDVAEKYIKSVSDKLAATGIETSHDITIGEPEEEIITTEERLHPDIIAMSTHGHSGFGRFEHGSTTDRVLHAGITPLLLVRPKKEQGK
jgi:nucleotide-binding universal stress UspA family protein